MASKFLTDKLPSMLRNATGKEGKTNAIDQIKQEMADQGFLTPAVESMFGQLVDKLNAEGNENKSNIELADELTNGGLNQFTQAADKARETLLNLAGSKYNDVLQQTINAQNKYNDLMEKSGEYLRKADEVRLNAELDLAKALGKSPSLEALNKPFNTEVKSLTQGLVDTGDLTANQAMDPMSIMRGIQAAEQRNQALQQANDNINNQGLGAVTNNDQRDALLAEQQNNIAAMGENALAIKNGTAALQKLATDGSKAANALSKIQEEQQKIEGFGNMVEKLATASPEELFNFNKQTAAFDAAQASGPDFMKSRRNRVDAFAGLNQMKEIMSAEEFRNAKADLVEKTLKSQGLKGNDRVASMGGKTVDEIVKRLRGGIDETDPNVKAYREATEVQAKANEALAKATETQAFIVKDAMEELARTLREDLPEILKNAAKESREAQETKPPVKAEEPKEKTQAEIDFGIAKTNIENSRQIIAGLDEKIKNTSDPKELERLKQERLEEQSVMFDNLGKSIEARGRISQEKAAAKAKEEQEAAANQAVENAKKDATVNNSLDQSRRARSNKEVKPAPPAPGVPSATNNPVTTTQSTVAANNVAKNEVNTTSTSSSQAPMFGSINNPAPEQFVKGEDATTRATKGYAATPERKAFVMNELKEARQRQKTGQKLSTDDSVISASVFELNNMKDIDLPLSPYQQAKKQQQQSNRQAYLARFRPEVRARMMTPEEKRAQQQANNGGTQEVPSVASNTSSPTTQQGPVPTNLPRPVETTRQTTAVETGSNNQNKQKTTETNATMVSLSPDSLKGLQLFTDNFAKYVDKLTSFEFPTIPQTIEMVGNHVVDVRVTGAAAMESLQDGIKKMINSEIDKHMSKIWEKTGGGIPKRLGSPPAKGQ